MKLTLNFGHLLSFLIAAVSMVFFGTLGSALAGTPVYNPEVAGVTCELKPIPNSNAMQRVDPTCGNVIASQDYEVIDGQKVRTGNDNGG